MRAKLAGATASFRAGQVALESMCVSVCEFVRVSHSERALNKRLRLA